MRKANPAKSDRDGELRLLGEACGKTNQPLNGPDVDMILQCDALDLPAYDQARRVCEIFAQP